MDYSLWERVAHWLCRTFGHRRRIEYGDQEICRRCNTLLSTAYSRAQEKP